MGSMRMGAQELHGPVGLRCKRLFYPQIAEPVPERELEDEHASSKQFRANTPRRLSSKLPPFQHPASSSRSSVSESSPSVRAADDPLHAHGHRHNRRQYYSEKLLAQVGEWLEREKKKAASGKKRMSMHRKSRSPPEGQDDPEHPNGRKRSDSMASDSSNVSLDRLQRILEDSMASLGLNSIPQYSSKAHRSRHRIGGSHPSLHRTASSDTEYFDGDVIVPSCDAWLDNSKTLNYCGGAADSDMNLPETEAKSDKDRDAWINFKNEIIRIAHTLRLKGWRRVPLDSGNLISVERLSGALTNAVYVVTPPADLPDNGSRNTPKKVLLRVYGPQAEHLIDRENELQVLQRLARKKIGPRLLGTFQNGRFEQYFNSITLTPFDLREPDTSKQIAKRMRELHDGIEVLHHERENGPAVWKNWDQWQEKVGSILTFLDGIFEKSRGDASQRSRHQAWLSNGYVCGVPWEQFRDMVAKYRAYIVSMYKDEKFVKDRLIFAHNDTQYGNILRIRPDDEKSPLLQAANKHKQLVVIDFEYAAANVPGLEFANHFTEWTYNYHDPVTSHACNERRYPTVEEQHRFIKAYVNHKSQHPYAGLTPRLKPLDSNPSSATGTPSLGPVPSTSSIVDFMLDARVPPGGWTAADRAREEQTDQQVRELMDEAQLWRPANSAFWIAWGIVQAKVPELHKGEEEAAEGEADGEMADEFDYLSYAQDRAYFFWGDCVRLGLAKKEDLPESLVSRLKLVEY
ncbi:kinase-like domain-containing protein [Stachybotrys elegans]|uniref:Kinase-like domain-containing protein n=1 Tax=Stachybotrys elegans TaxID=80388 RepID=A0A8K0WPW9_9HYPO|nr:kinase-like domain-containing protein [Stachybotrys elegans]